MLLAWLAVPKGWTHRVSVDSDASQSEFKTSQKGGFTVALHRNGASLPAVTLSLSEEDPMLAFSTVLRRARSLDGLAAGVLLHNSDGRPIKSLAPGSVDVYALRPGELWVWPSVNRTMSISGREYRLESLSSSPRVVRISSLLDTNECDVLVASANGRWQSSGSFDTSTRAHYDLSDGRRVSDTAWAGLHWGRVREGVLTNATVELVQSRATDAARVHLGHAEPWQVVRYQAGGYQRHHQDSYVDPTLGTARHATVIVYLSDVPASNGGATNFPHADRDSDEYDPESCSEGLSVCVTSP